MTTLSQRAFQLAEDERRRETEAVTEPARDLEEPPSLSTRAFEAARQQRERQQAELNLSTPPLQPPEMAARARRDAGVLGVELPSDDLTRSEAEFRRAQAALRSSPRLSRWYADPRNAEIARDDVAPLTFWEMAGRRAGDVQSWTQALASNRYLLRGLRNMRIAELQDRINPESAMPEVNRLRGRRDPGALSFTEYAELQRLMAADPTLPEAETIPELLSEYGPMVPAAIWAALENSWTSMRQEWRRSQVTQDMTPLEYAVRTDPVGRSLRVAGAGITGLISGAPIFMYQQEAGNAFREFSNFVDEDGNRLNPRIAGAYARDVGIINAAIEVTGIGVTAKVAGLGEVYQALTRTGVRTALRRMGYLEATRRVATGIGGAAATEGLTELTQEGVVMALGQLAQQAQGGEWAELSDEEVAERMWQSFRVGALLGGVFGAVPAGGRFVEDLSSIRAARAREAMFSAFGDAAQASALRQRSPGAFADAVDQMVAGGPISEVSIDAEQFAEVFRQEGESPEAVADALRGVGAETLRAALEAGTDIKIPMGTYAAQIIGTPVEGKLGRHVRMGPDELTTAEVEARLEFGEKFERMAGEVSRLQRETARNREAVDTVNERLTEHFARTGYIPQAQRNFIKLFSEALVVQGERLGRSPSEMLDRIGFRIATDTTDGRSRTPLRDALVARLDSLPADAARNPFPRDTLAVARPQGGGEAIGYFTLDAPREIATAGGPVQAEAGDVVLVEPDGLMRPVKPDEFAEQYEAVDERAGAFEQDGVAPWIAERFSPDEIADYLALADNPNSTPEQILNHPLHLAIEAEAPAPTFTAETIAVENPLAGRLYRVGEEMVDVDAYLEHMRQRFETEVGAPLRQERKAVIVTGQPGAGKSTTRAALARMYGAVSVDLDEMRTGIPEFDGGRGSSNVTQYEAGYLREILADSYAEQGQNLLVEIVGRAEEHVLKAAARLQAQGYEVSLASVAVSFENSVRRYAKRTIAGGRWVHSSFIASVQDQPSKIFDALVAEGSLSGYIQIDGNGPQGSETVRAAHGAIDPAALQAAISEHQRSRRSDALSSELTALRQDEDVSPAPDGSPSAGVRVSEIQSRADPFGPVNLWDESQPPITVAEVRRAMQRGRGEARDYTSTDTQGWTREDHINRIATLARDGWADPIDLSGAGGVHDGLHRLAAAIVRGDETIGARTRQGVFGHGDGGGARIGPRIENANGSWQIVDESGAVLERLPRGSTFREADAVLGRMRTQSGGADPGFEFFQSPVFVSAVARTVEQSKTARASGSQWWATISKAPGVKREELQWMGLEDFLKGQEGQVSREDVLAFVRENGVRVEETVLGGDSVSPEVQRQLLPLIEERDRLQNAMVGDNSLAIAAATQDAVVQDAAQAFRNAQAAETEALARELEGASADAEAAFQAADKARLELRRAAKSALARLNESIARLEGERRQTDTKWSQYTLPGGENYRELLLRLPSRSTAGYEIVPHATPSGPGFAIRRPDGSLVTTGVNSTNVATWSNRGGAEATLRGEFGTISQLQDFKSSHYDQPNILAHVRFKERVDSFGRRTLFIEEVQSDWHQAGRERGYKPANQEALVAEQRALMAEQSELQAADRAGNGDAARLAEVEQRLSEIMGTPGAANGVPDAPFKNNAWANLSMKRMIRWAAENGFDQIAWTRGETQNARFSLEKQIDAIEYVVSRDGATVTLNAIKDDGVALVRSNMPVAELPGLVGKEIADKIIAGAGETIRMGRNTGYRSLSGLDLQVGGEGMRAFYDRILVNIANDLGKKYGARTGETQITADKEGWHITPPDQTVSGRWMVKSSDYNSRGLQFDTEVEARAALAEKQSGAQETVHSLPITPEMRDAAMEGMQLFQRGARGSVAFRRDESGLITESVMRLFDGRNLSTPIHEMGHIFLELLRMVAADPNAPASAQKDWQTALDWMGLTEEQWADYSTRPLAEATDLLRPYHEKWARGFEAYAREGNAPSMALREVFHAFKRWLTMIYKAVTELRVTLTPEIREVFDRLLATEEAIAEAKQASGAARPMPREQFGGSDAAYQRYVTQFERAEMEATEAVDKAAMTALYADRTRDWRKREREIRAAVEASYDERPEQRAKDWLAYGLWRNGEAPEGLPPMRLSPASVVAEYGEDTAGRLPSGVVSPDIDGLVDEAIEARKILNARPPVTLSQKVRLLGGIRPDDPNASDVSQIEDKKPGSRGALVAEAQYFRRGKDEMGNPITERVPARTIDDMIVALWEDGFFGAKPEKGAFGQFAGEGARTADMASLQVAKDMQESGADENAIWQATGWALGEDGQWRFEIDTNGARITVPLRQVRETQIRALSEVLDFPALYEAYPQMADVPVDLALGQTSGAWDRNHRYDKGWHPLLIVRGRSLASARKTLLHEIQHAIQDIEGMATGGDWKSAAPEAAALFESLRNEIARSEVEKNRGSAWARVMFEGDEARHMAFELKVASQKAAWETYWRLAGEVEARNVERRTDMTSAEKRATAPNVTADVPAPERIVVMAAPGSSFSAPSDSFNQAEAPHLTQTRAFARWFGESKVVDENGDPLVVYHGTTGDVEAFDTERANAESDLGGGFYFTNTKEDVGENYAGFGPDLTNKIQLEAERIAAETDREYNDPEVIAEARQRHAAHDGMTMPVYLSMQNPVVLGGPNETTLTYDSNYNEELDEYGEPTGSLADFMDALRDVASRYDDGSADSALATIEGEAFDGGMTARKVIEALKADEQFGYFADENGKLVSNEIIRLAFERAGFDGFIDYTVNDKFGSNRFRGQSMAGMNEDTVHYIAFRPTQIKSAIGNTGTFDPNDPSILRQEMERPDLNEFLDALQRDLRGENIYRLDDQADAERIRMAEQLRDWFGQNGVDINTRKRADLRAQVEKMAARVDDDGVDADTAARFFGFDSGRDMLDAMIAAPGRAEYIKTETRKRLIDEFGGDPFADGTIAEEAVKAMHGARRAKVIEIELDTIDRATGGQFRPVDRAARDIAKARVDRMNISNIRRYNWFLAQERREAQAAARALEKGDYQAAREAKYRQLINHHLFELARKASEEVDVSLRYLKKFTRPGVRQNIENGYLDQIDQLLDQYELKRLTGPQIADRINLTTWAARMEAAGRGHLIAVDPRILERSRRQPFQQLELDEARGLIETIKNIEYLGRLKEKLLDAADQRSFNEVIGDAVDAMNATGAVSDKVKQNYSDSRLEAAGTELRKWNAQMTRMEFLFRYLDGKANGPIWRALWQPFAKAADKEAIMQRNAAATMQTIWNRYSSAERGRMFKTKIPMYDLPVGAATHYTKAELIAIALNIGNEGNLRALVDGFGWGGNMARQDVDYAAARQQIVRSLNRVLDERDWQTVQAIWDHIGTYRDEAFALQEDLTGVRPEAVAATAVETPYGVFAGGYYPLKFDGQRDLRQARADEAQEIQDMFGSNWSKPMTKKGHLINRVGSGGRPVKLNLNVFAEHVQNVTHDIAYRKAILDADRIMQDPRFAETFIRVAGREMYDQLRPWLQGIAADRADPSAFFWQLLQKMRGNVAIAAMGYRLSTALQQLTGLLQAVPMLGSVEMAAALAKLVSNPTQISAKAEWIRTKSEFMRNRISTFDRDVRETISRMEKNDPLAPMRENAFMLVGVFDWAVSSVVWTAAYEKALSGNVNGIEGGVDADAIAYADTAVRSTQSAGLQQDLPAIMRGSQTNKLMTMFFSYFSVLYNWTAYDQILGVRKGRISKAAFIGNMALIYIIAPLIAEALAGRWEPREDETEEERNARLAAVIIRYPFATIPFIRDIAGVAGTTFEYQLSPVESAPGAIIRAGTNIVEGDAFENEDTTKGVVVAAGYLFGAPTPQAWIPTDYVADKLEGQERPGFDFYEAFVRDSR